MTRANAGHFEGEPERWHGEDMNNTSIVPVLTLALFFAHCYAYGGPAEPDGETRTSPAAAQTSAVGERLFLPLSGPLDAEARKYVETHITLKLTHTNQTTTLLLTNHGGIHVQVTRDCILWARILANGRWDDLHPITRGAIWNRHGLPTQRAVISPGESEPLYFGVDFASSYKWESGTRIRAYLHTSDGFILKSSDVVTYTNPPREALQVIPRKQEFPEPGDGSGITLEETEIHSDSNRDANKTNP